MVIAISRAKWINYLTLASFILYYLYIDTNMKKIKTHKILGDINTRGWIE